MTMSNTAAYQKAYYATHPELKDKAKARERQKRIELKTFRDAQFLRSSERSPTQRESKVSVLIELLALPFLLVCLTYLLFHEMVLFYSASEASPVLYWMKAIAMEASVLIFSFLGHSSSFRGVVYKLVAIAVCLFSTWAMCVNHYSNGVRLARADLITERSIADLEVSIRRKEIQSDEYRSKHWVGAVNRTEKSIDGLREKLDHLREKLLNAKPAAVTNL